MDIRFYLDPDTGLPHIYGHGVTEEEVEQVLRASGGDIQGSRGSRMKLRPDLGRALSPGHLLARRGTGERLRDHRYELTGNAKRAYRRRRRRKPQ
ncbi:MAG: hypothetical protein ACLQU5_24215 [Isosphaeraceae bacterium]